MESTDTGVQILSVNFDGIASLFRSLKIWKEVVPCPSRIAQPFPGCVFVNVLSEEKRGAFPPSMSILVGLVHWKKLRFELPPKPLPLHSPSIQRMK